MSVKVIQYIFLFFLCLSIVFFAYAVFSPFISHGVSVNILMYSFGKFAGLIGLLSLSTLIVSGDTARFFDRFLGIDKIIKFQRKFGLITTIVVLLHPIFFILSDASFASYLIPDYASIPLALGTISLYMIICVEISSKLYKRISYKSWQFIHVLTYVLFFFSLYHATKIGSDADSIVMKAILSVLFAMVIAGLLYRIIYKIRRRNLKFHVREVRWESENTFTLVLDSSRPFSFKAGQFCFLRIDKNKLYARHPFTMSNSPQDRGLSFTIKLGGRFTKAASELERGDEVIVEGPFGVFTINDRQKDLVFVAGGIGITPFISMLRNRLKSNESRNVLLLYGAKTGNDLIFRKELDAIKEDWFKKIYVLSRDEDSLCERGHIDRYLIEKNVRNIKSSIFYICGPENMKKDVRKALIDMGVKRSDIKTEDFFW